MVLLDTGTPGTSREIFSEDADGDIVCIWYAKRELSHKGMQQKSNLSSSQSVAHGLKN